jgi:WD40 repeat protein
LSGAVRGVKLSPDGKLALVEFFYTGEGSRAPERRPLKLFDLEAGREVRGFKGLSLTALDFLPSSKQMLGRAADETLTIWDTRSGEVVRTFQQGRGRIECVAVSPDGRYALTSAYSTGDLQGWDVPNGKVLWARESRATSVSWFTFQPDGQLAFLGGERAALCLWNVIEGKPVDTFDRRPRWGHRCAFSPDGKLMVADHVLWTLEDQKKARLVLAEVPTGKALRQFAERTGGAAGTGTAHALAFSPDGKHLASADDDFMIRLWDVESGCVISSTDYREWGQSLPAFSWDGRLALSVGIEHILPSEMELELKFWNIPENRLVRAVTTDTVP